MRMHRTKDCPQTGSDEDGAGGADEGSSSSDDSDEDLVAMMMRATCQDGQVRQRRATKEKTEVPGLRSGQRARVIFLRDDDGIGVERVYTDAEVQFFCLPDLPLLRVNLWLT